MLTPSYILIYIHAYMNCILHIQFPSTLAQEGVRELCELG